MIRPFAAALRRSAFALPYLAMLVSLLLFAPSAQALGPSLSANPPGQSAGGTVTLGGSGYLPGAPITFTFDGNPIATNPSSVTSDATGAFSGVKLTVPSGTSLGPHSIAASDPLNTAARNLNVDSLSVTPAGQSQGQKVTLSGSHFAPGATVSFTFGGTAINTNPAAVTTDPSGNFSNVQITVPSGAAAGSYPLRVKDSANNVAVTPFNVDTISVSPNTGPPDNPLSVSGTGWLAGHAIQTQIDGSTVCQLVANAQGAIAGDQSNGCRVPAGLAPGNHRLTAIDITNGSSQATGANFIVPSDPVAAFTGPAAAPPATVLTFDGSSSRAPSQIQSYDWNWGDGTSDTVNTASATASHTYATADTYIVTLTITDGAGQTSRATHTVSIQGPPTASFTPGSTTVETGTPISFDGSGSSDPNGTIEQYSWDFGDGATANGQTPSHAYAKAGTYTVTLSVTDAVGAVQSVSQTVTVTDRSPLASFTPTAATVLAGSSVLFDGTGSSDPDGSVAGYSWNFGDGGTSTASQPSHTYMQTGTFTVSLTVTDDSGNQTTVSHPITVIAPPPLQTLILTPLAAPALVKAGPPSTTPSGLVKLGQQVFCPGPGVACTVTIIATSRAVRSSGSASGLRPVLRIGRSHMTITANGSAALKFTLSKAARAYLRRQGRLPLRITVTIIRSNLTTKRAQRLTLRG